MLKAWSLAHIIGTTYGGLTTGQWQAAVVAAAVFCFVVGYLFAVQSHRITGSYPWHMPPIFWAFVGAVLPVAGVVLQAIARLTTASASVSSVKAMPEQTATDAISDTSGQVPPQPQQTYTPPGQWGVPPAQSPTPGPPYAPGAWQSGATPVPPGPPPAYNQGQWPAPLGPEAFQQPGGPVATPQQAPSAAPADWQESLLTPQPPTPPPLFGWYPDPTGRHEQRYWDGRQWSHRVADDAVRSDDPQGAT